MPHEKIDTWREACGIDERCRTKRCGAAAKAQAIAMEDAWRWYRESSGKHGQGPRESLRDLARHANHPLR